MNKLYSMSFIDIHTEVYTRLICLLNYLSNLKPMRNVLTGVLITFLFSSYIYADGSNKIFVVTSKPQVMSLYDTYGVLGECKNATSKDIYAKIAGTITTITKKEGDFVQKGEVILSINYNNFEVIAPFDGQIGTIAYKINQDVKAGDFLVSIISGDDKEIIFNVPEKILRVLTKDAELLVQDSKHSAIQAKIISKSPYLNTSGNSLIKVVVQSNNLIHGSFINAELRYNHHKGLVVPEYVVLKSVNGSYVYVKNPQSKAIKAFVNTGSKLNDMVEIIGDDVDVNTLVITDGLTKIYEFANVEEHKSDDYVPTVENNSK